MLTYDYSAGSNSDSAKNGQEPSEKISTLIARLGNKEGIDRKRARLALIRIGEPAVPQLIEAFKHHRTGLAHWEAAKALSLIGSRQTVDVFIEALMDDEDTGVRWLAAEGLVSMGQDSVVPLLKALEHHSDSLQLREGAHHILHDFVYRRTLGGTYQTLLTPVLQALDEVEPALEVPIAAYHSLRALNGEDTSN